MPRPRKHHYLPQFYLKGFSDNGTHIYQVEKGTGVKVGGRIADTAAIRDFHTLDFEDCPDPDALEKLVSDLESDLAPALATVTQTGRIDASTRPRISQLVSMLQARIPATKSLIEGTLQEVLRSIGMKLDKDGKLPAKPEGLEDALAFEKIEISIANWKVMQFMFDHAFDSDLIKLIGRASIVLLRAPTDCQFVTSDQPVAIFNSDARPEDGSGRGLIDPYSEISLPLSSSLALVLHWASADTQHHRIASREEVDEINRRTITMASKRIFAASIDDAIDRLLLLFGHCEAGSRMDVMRSDGSAYHLMRTVPVMHAALYEPLGATYAYVPVNQRPEHLRGSTAGPLPLMVQRMEHE